MYDTGLRITPGTSIELVHTCGRCFHAYGMSRGLSKKLWGLLADGHDTLCSLSAQHKKFPAGWTPEMNFADYVVNENLCSQLSGGGILVVGRNLEARDGGHVGVIWQDRGRFPSIVENTEGGVV